MEYTERFAIGFKFLLDRYDFKIIQQDGTYQIENKKGERVPLDKIASIVYEGKETE